MSPLTAASVMAPLLRNEYPPRITAVDSVTRGSFCASAEVQNEAMTPPSSPSPRDHSLDEAALFLGLSRAFVEREVAAGRLSGLCGRIGAVELQEYKQRLRADQEAALDEMAADARRLGLSY